MQSYTHSFNAEQQDASPNKNWKTLWRQPKIKLKSIIGFLLVWDLASHSTVVMCCIQECLFYKICLVFVDAIIVGAVRILCLKC
jgi:hypothetical protein